MPAIICNNFKLSESHTIMRFLCSEFNLPDYYYPKDIRKRFFYFYNNFYFFIKKLLYKKSSSRSVSRLVIIYYLIKFKNYDYFRHHTNTRKCSLEIYFKTVAKKLGFFLK